jgi:hypothetical protein
LVPGSDTLLLLGGFPQISVTARIVFYQVWWKEVMSSYKIHIGFELEVFYSVIFSRRFRGWRRLFPPAFGRRKC